jgi:hypothetical protein
MAQFQNIRQASKEIEMRCRRQFGVRDPHDHLHAFTAEAYRMYRQIPDERLSDFWQFHEKRHTPDTPDTDILPVYRSDMEIYFGQQFNCRDYIHDIQRLLMIQAETKPKDHCRSFTQYLKERPSYYVYDGRKVEVATDPDRVIGIIETVDKLRRTLNDIEKQLGDLLSVDVDVVDKQ